MKFARFGAAALALALFAMAARADENSFNDPKGAVRDPEAALTIAHAMWRSIFRSVNPGEDIPTLQSWQEDGCAAVLHDKVWDVVCPERGMGGGLTIRIGKQDGRLLSVVIRQ